MASPLVSVIIPCYNQGRYLAEAIDSACGQSYPNAEVIVVDDGSTDETREVARRYPDVTYVHHRNAGTAEARNLGLKTSRGEYVIFLDADDRLLPDAATCGVDSLVANPFAGLVTGHVRLIAADGTVGIVPDQEHEPAGYAALLRWNYIWTPGVAMYRRAALETAGAFRSSAGGSADYELNIRIARRYDIACHHHVILEYRQHGASMSRDAMYMLRSALGVRRAEKRIARRAGLEDAWRVGVRSVQAGFGARLVDQIKGDLTCGRWWRAGRGMLCLLRDYPAGLAKMAAPREWQKLIARRWRTAAP